MNKLEYILKGVKMKNKLILIIWILVFFISCSMGDKNIINHIELEKWDSITLEVLNNECEISNNDYNKKKNTPSKYIRFSNDKVYWTIEEQVKDWLGSREYFLSLVRSDSTIRSREITLVETCTMNKTVFVLKTDSGYYYYKEDIRDTGRKGQLEKLNSEEAFEWELMLDSECCEYVNEIDHHLKHMRIITRVWFIDDKVNYEIVFAWLW